MALTVRYGEHSRNDGSAWTLFVWLSDECAFAVPDSMRNDYAAFQARHDAPSVLTSIFKRDVYALGYLRWLDAHGVIALSCDALFAYGSLMPGETHADRIADAIASTYDEPYTVPGRLYAIDGYAVAHLGEYTQPDAMDGLRIARVRGVLYALAPKRAAKVLAALDAFEEAPPEYRRELVYVESTLGDRQPAWTYVAPNAERVSGGEVVVSGDWRTFDPRA